MKIGIIGAGAAGLASLKYALEEGHECEVFEQTGLIGGTWNLVDSVGVDEYGLPIHSSMYTGLLTNVPKEVMYYLDFPYPDLPKSYIKQKEVLEYINDYAKHFNLFTHIQFYKHVIRIELNNEKWNITVLDLKTKVEETKSFDAVMICRGNYSNPSIPHIEGVELFKGNKIHSRDYRSPERFANKKVLIIGAGPSGRDICMQVATEASVVFLSHNLEEEMTFAENVIQKPPVEKFFEKGAVFQDSTVAEIDEIIYCTGFTYTFPFLTENCNIKIENNWVQPLYKQIVNINHPTMGFIGLPYKICCFPSFDVQVRFFLATLSGHFKLPSKKVMLDELEEYMTSREADGIPRRHAHLIGETQGLYFEDLANTAKIKPIPPVISKLYMHIRNGRDINQCFKIIDDETFVQLS